MINDVVQRALELPAVRQRQENMLGGLILEVLFAFSPNLKLSS